MRGPSQGPPQKMNCDSVHQMNSSERQKALALKFYRHLLAGNKMHPIMNSDYVCESSCELCAMQFPMGYYILEWRMSTMVIEPYVICHECVCKFNKTYNATSAQLKLLHASKARLLPLGDVCGVIAAVLVNLVGPADVYWAIV